MGKQANPYSLRVNPVTMEKIKIIAALNDRSLNGQIENILKKYVAEYERENGVIDVSKPDEATD